jgi:hypothetical protein
MSTRCSTNNSSGSSSAACARPSRGSSSSSSRSSKPSSSSCDSSTDTLGVIRGLCGDCDSMDGCGCDPTPACSTRYDPGISEFPSVITPLSNLTPLYSGQTGCVEFNMRRKNKTVILQWEPFTGTLSANGVATLTVAQSIANLPAYTITSPIYIQYKSIGRMTRVEINPHAPTGNIFFYLNSDSSASGTVIGDVVTVPGGSVSWITN